MKPPRTRFTYTFCVLIIISATFCECAITPEMQRFPEPYCPGICTSIFDCKAAGGKVLGTCQDGKMCCGGFNTPSGTCGSSVVARKTSTFRSPNYPAYSGGNLICEFTLQLNPATVGIRVDFTDLSLATIPSNPINFYESPNAICDSDFLMFRGFSGWAPDFRCGNLTGYSFMFDRENGQRTLSAIFIMGSNKYRWDMEFTEIYYNEVESLDYALRNSIDGIIHNNKKQWMWYGYGSGISPESYPLGSPIYPPSLLAPPLPPFHVRPFSKRNADVESIDEIQLSNTTVISHSTLNITELVEVLDSPVTGSPLSRVVGGVNAQPNSVPWQVSLQLVDKMTTSICGEDNEKKLSSHFCGGTIIGERTILTASHCFHSSSRYSHPLIPWGSVKVVVGEHDFCTESEVSSTRDHTIERIVLHYNYLSTDVINDIAVIHLTKPIQFNKNVHPIMLAEESTKIEEYKPLLSGWGSLGVEENSTYPAILQQSSNIHIFSQKECAHFQREFLDYVMTESKLPGKYRGAYDHGICTGSTDNVTEAGFGDSGGPLAGIPPAAGEGMTPGKKPVLFGVVSHMRPHNDPATKQDFHMNYYVKVASYRKWILMSMFTAT